MLFLSDLSRDQNMLTSFRKNPEFEISQKSAQ
jgi:hypothetical protein